MDYDRITFYQKAIKDIARFFGIKRLLVFVFVQRLIYLYILLLKRS